MKPRIQTFPYLNTADIFAQLQNNHWPVWLDSCAHGKHQARYDIISADPFIKIKTQGRETVVVSDASSYTTKDNPFLVVKDILKKYPLENNTTLPFVGGAIGHFSYDLFEYLEDVPKYAERDLAFADMHIGVYDWAVIVDHHEQCCYLVQAGFSPDAKENWDTAYHTLSLCCTVSPRLDRGIHFAGTLENNADSLAVKDLHCKVDPTVKPRDDSANNSDNAKSNFSRETYKHAFDKIQSYIHAGDCYQINLAQRFQMPCTDEPLLLYQHLRQKNPAPYSAFLRYEEGSLLSLSPERFLNVTNQLVETKPIKGTAPRHNDPLKDKQLAEELRGSIKNCAENVMIVDLLRNDLSKTCEPGSVKVPQLFALESYPAVHHLVSTVTGRLKPDQHSLDALMHAFPGGSITGAPKVRAMHIIEELEPHQRNVYCGAIGYIDFTGNMDTNIAIRTLLHHQDQLYCWAGGGIVADSNCDAEYLETLYKIQKIFPVTF